MRNSILASIVLGTFLLTLSASEVAAQSTSRALDNARNRYNLNPANSIAQGILNRPTVSPYLNLLGTDGRASGAARYQTLVRPQLEARRTQLQTSARITGVQSQLQRVSTAIGGASSQQSLGNYPFTTGHPSVYLNGSHYYPRLGQ